MITFKEAWAKKKSEGYQYGPVALEQVLFGWELAKREFGLSFDDYQAGAERTANRRDVDTVDKRLANFALGLAGESGEVADIIKKHLFHGHLLDEVKLKKELGDVLWYLATLAETLGMRLEDVAQANLDKLRSRYPEGFSVERSVNRKDSETLPDPKEAPTMTRMRTAPPEKEGA